MYRDHHMPWKMPTHEWGVYKGTWDNNVPHEEGLSTMLPGSTSEGVFTKNIHLSVRIQICTLPGALKFRLTRQMGVSAKNTLNVQKCMASKDFGTTIIYLSPSCVTLSPSFRNLLSLTLPVFVISDTDIYC